MEATHKEIEAIFKTLPIGYYCGRNYATELVEDEKTSYYVPSTETIIISSKIIIEGLSKMAEGTMSKETAVRTMLYHELSHALMTPKNLWIDNITNIFEDERIETLLDGYYMDTDFKGFVKSVCGYNPNSVPNNADEAFYEIVRFRKGEKIFTDKVEEIINRFSNLTDNNIHDYESAIYNLYYAIEKYFNKNSNQNKNSNSNGNNSNSNENFGNESININGASNDKINDSDNSILASTENRNSQRILIENSMNNKNFKLSDSNEIYNSISPIVANFNKKNSGGNSIYSYNGVFNPKNVIRKDYKWFDKKVTINGNNQFGTLHLNLFLDQSGSFYANENKANALLKALDRLEKSNKNFTFDLVTINSTVKLIKDKKRRFINTGGCTAMTSEIKPIYDSLQKPNTYNYNLVMFDGRFDVYNYKGKPVCTTFNNTKTTFIVDSECVYDVKKYAPNANLIVTDDYVKELTKNVIKVLSTCFR